MSVAGEERDSEAIAARLPLTALVASHNEAEQLARCLPTIGFCDEVIVIDIESEDRTAEVAMAHGARVLRHPYVPIAEWARVEVAKQARHEWMLFTDPDEQIPLELATAVRGFLDTVPDDVGLVWAPIRFLFAGRPLEGTIWGDKNHRRFLVRRSAADLTATVFGGTRLRPGYRMVELPFTEETAIRHDWVTGYRDWIAKHRRYLELQGADRVGSGELTGVKGVAATPFRSFWGSFVVKRGYRDGLTGLALSLLWAVFSTASEVALLRGRGRDRSSDE